MGQGRLGFYNRQIVPRLVDLACGLRTTAALRERVCQGLAGRVLEIGFGSGLNVSFYPPAVTQVDAVEPADLGWRLAAQRLAGATIPVVRSGLDGQALPFDDNTFEAALSTWTLCTIPDPAAALQEISRVLKPGGLLHFVEHGLAPDQGVRRWQRRLEPIQRRVAGGCHLTRPVLGLLTAGDFTVIASEEFYEPGAPRPLGALTLGTARPAGPPAA